MRDRASFSFRVAPHKFPTLRRALLDERPLVVLDLDGTLIHTLPRRLRRRASEPFVMRANGEELFVYVRPGVETLVDALNECDVRYAVWTAATAEYAREVVGALSRRTNFRPLFVWSRDRTDKMYRKDMRLPRGAGATGVVLIDDAPHHLSLASNAGRVELVPPFDATSTRRDRVLSHLGRAVRESRYEARRAF